MAQATSPLVSWKEVTMRQKSLEAKLARLLTSDLESWISGFRPPGLQGTKTGLVLLRLCPRTRNQHPIP